MKTIAKTNVQSQKNSRFTPATNLKNNSNEKVMFQHRNTLQPYYPKEHALRELTQLYSFTGLNVVHDNSDKNQKQTNDANCLTQLLEPKNKENTRQKSQELSIKQILQKQRKNRKLEEKILPQERKEKFQQRQSSPLRNQPRKDYKTFIPQT